jgi:hypothetical protein
MLEKQEGAVREEGGDAALRLPVSLSGEINAATRYAFSLETSALEGLQRIEADTQRPQNPPHISQPPHNIAPPARPPTTHIRPHTLRHRPPPLRAHLPHLRVLMG